jgi:hypothetical protein
MIARDPQFALKLFCIMVMIVLFAASSANATQGCERASGKSGWLTGGSAEPHSNVAASDPALGVQDTMIQESRGLRALDSLLALHCQAVASLPLGGSVRPYGGSACAESESHRSLQ